MTDQPENDQKTEAPTAKRRTDAARDGDVLQSKELGTAFVMLAGAMWCVAIGPRFLDSCMNMLKQALSLSVADVRHFDPASATMALLPAMLFPMFSLFGFAIFGAVAAPAALGALGFRGDAMAFKGSRINPAAGLKRIFGLQGPMELGKALIKATLLGTIGYWIIARDMRMIRGLSSSDLAAALTTVGHSVTWALVALSCGLLLIAGADVPMQMFRRNARLRMTKQEIKEEMRQSEGAPELKNTQRQRAREIMSGSARKAVSEATVILTNPTHFAVALRYRPGYDAAPMVMARGRGEVAIAIRLLAKESGVPTLEYPQLARAIYFTARAGHAVAEDLYIAVATILAFVFNLEKAMAQGVRQPNVTVPDAKRFDEHGKAPTR
jgi:flagellar biosynthesis protein FlhB